ncbi:MULTISPECIES: FxSxx-COOH system tetratricopeptide repeat protein [Streptomyces]|uniref:ATP/GTP-binding protein n=1 Tax=Streptomyces griseorubiginosus TaxID=67304 RepID=A0A101RU75_9ACTN|nr:FxSxx-COOH system tetratricopeptide repeat protein [Streptomyces griseorubiginosus]KUN61837.1 ATP/GTP-binding protein [Streptomyces griseorubiginosus]
MTENRKGSVITFYSYKGGTGRTMALANVAWILAANGYRVLAVDWDLEAPGLHRFFHPFLKPSLMQATPGLINLIDDYRREALRDLPDREPDWHRHYARVRPHALSLDWAFPEPGSLDFLSAGMRHRDYPIVGNMDWDSFYNSYGGGQFFDAMRADMERYYDFTLIDSRTGHSDLADICTVQMPSTLVVCYTLSDQSIEGAAAVAQHIEERYGDKGIRILPVAMRIDDGEKDKVDAGRALARERFDGLPSGMDADELTAYWGSVEIPYRPYYAYEEILAPFGDPPKVASSMLTACERLTSVVTGGRVTSLPPLNEIKRNQYVAAYTRRRPLPPSKLLLQYVSEDRMWADWLEAVLREARFEVTSQDLRSMTTLELGSEAVSGGSQRALAVVSPAFLGSRTARAAWEATVHSGGPQKHQPIALRVGDVQQIPYAGRGGTIDLARLDEETATAALLTGLGRPSSPQPSARPHGARFPNSSTSVSNVQPRYPFFTGRSSILEQVRRQFVTSAPGGGLPQVLHGLGGVGKTQLAREYANRFKPDYDLVWWVDAEQADLVAPKLADLGRRLAPGIGDDVSEAAVAALQALRAGHPYKRWLLVFDNVEDLDEVLNRFSDQTGPIPDDVYGHLLVTTRTKPTSTRVRTVEVEVFTREESVEHLTARVPGLREEDAALVAEAVGDLPLAIEVAAAWLATTATPVGEYIEQLRDQSTQVLSVQAAVNAVEYPSSVGATWNISVARLRHESPAAARLLELCSFLSAEPISMALVGSDAMIKALLPYDKDLRARYMLGKVTQALNRFALAKVDATDNSIQVHRLVQAAVRDSMDPRTAEDTVHEVHRILAAIRPSEDAVDDPAKWPEFEVIWPHLVPSNIRECAEEEPRQLMVDRMRYLWKRGELHLARTLGTQLNEFWSTEFADSNDEQILNLRFELANILRSQGEYQAAREMDEDTLARQRQLLDDGHPSLLITSGNVAADLRALGRFKEALELDQRNYNGFREIFGEDHSRTLRSANNLAIDHRLTGDSEAARRLDEDTVRRRTAMDGPLHPYTLTTRSHYARDLRELGEYDESVEILRQVRELFGQVLNPYVPEVLRVDKSLAVSLRKAGRHAEALELSEQTWETHTRYRDRYGRSIPEELACGLNLAADYHATDPEQGAQRAVRQVTEVLEGYRNSFGPGHPFTMFCINNLATYHRALGESGRAAELAEQAHTALARALGNEHPATLSAGASLANALADLGRLEEAEHFERLAVTGLRKRLGPTHPDTLAAMANLAITLRALGHDKEATKLHQEAETELVQRLGETHPLSTATAEWRRIDRDLEPQQV